MALSYKVFPGTPYYSNTALTTQAGTIVNTTAATYVNTSYGTVSVGGSTYYVAYGQMVSFYNSSFTGAQIDDAVSKRACIVEASLVTTAEAIYNGFSGTLDNSGNPKCPIIIRRDNGITTTVDLALATVTEGLDGQTSYLLYTFTGVEAKTTYYLGVKKKGSTITFSPDYTRKNLQEALTFDTTPTANSTNPVTSGGIKSAFNATDSAIAILANGNTHIAITKNQFVFVSGHNTLSEGLYQAKTDISANATLSSSNLTPVSGGGLNQFLSKSSDNPLNERLLVPGVLTIAEFCALCDKTNQHGVVSFSLGSANSQILSGASGTGFGFAKRINATGGNLLYYVLFQPASRTIAFGNINASTQDVTIYGSFQFP